MSFVAGVGLFALLQAEPGGAGPPIQRPKSATTEPSDAASETVFPPEPAAEPPATSPPEVSQAESAWPDSETVVPTPGQADPEAAPVSEPLPAPSDSTGSDPQRTLRLPDETGRGLMIGSIATGALGWAMSFGSIGVITQDCDGLGECFGQLETFFYLTGVRWGANGAAMGLAIPAGARRGKYDATKDAIEGAPARNVDAFVRGGAAAVGVGAAGWVIMRIGLFTFFQRCGGSGGCGIGYLVGLQTSFALASAGSGVLSYGLAYRKHSGWLGRSAEVRVVPQLSPEYSGLSLAGRF